MNFSSIKEWINSGMPFNSFVLGDCNEAMKAMPQTQIRDEEIEERKK